MKCIFSVLIFVLILLKSKADTIDGWSIFQNDSCLIQANINYFNEGKEFIYVSNADSNKEYIVSYSRDIGRSYNTLITLLFEKDGEIIYSKEFQMKDPWSPIKFKFSEILDNNLEFKKGDTIRMRYIDKNEYFVSDTFIGSLIIKENISDKYENTYTYYWIILLVLIFLYFLYLVRVKLLFY